MNRLLFMLLVLLLTGPFALAQSSDSAAAAPVKDSLNPYVKKISNFFAKQKEVNKAKYEAERNSDGQRSAMEEARKTLQQVKLYLRSSLDTALLSQELRKVDAMFTIVKDGIFIHKGTAQTERNLSVSSAILRQLIIQLEAHKKHIDAYNTDVNRFRERIDSLFTHPAIYVIPSDSVKVRRYIQRLAVISREASPIDDALEDVQIRAQNLQNQVDTQLFSLRVASEEIEQFREELSVSTLKRQFPDIWAPAGYSRPFATILQFSRIKEYIALQFYLEENTGKLLIVLILILLLSFSFRALRKRLQEDGHLADNREEPLIVRHPVSASIVIVLSIFQFLFLYAPFIFNFGLWLITTTSLLILLRHFISVYWRWFWIIALLLFTLACTDNLILQASRIERWFMLALSLGGLLFGTLILTGGHRAELREKAILYAIRFLILAESLSLLLNIFGRYNLSKSIMICGYTGLVLAVLFLWVVRLLNESLELANIVYRHSEHGFLNINFNRLGSKTPRFLYIALVVGWIVLTGRNFYAFKHISVPFVDLLKQERSIGEYTFTINGLFLLLLITLVSVLLSKFVSFFAADPDATHGSTESRHKKGVGIGSWILLLRILIISLGLFLAFAAAGIPFDKLTIILGALSVGVGLGLQDLVKNLVSGLVIAFEKPVKAGDIVEINGRTGTMKSIGFRSSIVVLNDGASLVVPNGDLLSQHLVNWNISRHIRRLSVTVGVGYNSDLDQVKSCMETVALGEELVLRQPLPVAVAREFGNSAIHFDLIFWIRQTSDAVTLTSNIISGIHKAFKEAGIEIPFPQQELHIRGIQPPSS